MPCKHRRIMSTTEKRKTTDEQHQQDLERLQKLRPIDDDFMRCLLRDNLPLAQLVLRIITSKPDLVLTRCETQKDLKRLAGSRSICLDAHGIDSIGTHFNLEIQREGTGADPHRARYHSSALDIENLHAGQEFDELPETCTIFITEKDLYGTGAPMYTIERMNLTTGKAFGDGEHIIYVNGEYRGDDDLGKLMHDFNCTDAEDMHFELMAERTEYLKKDPKGVRSMCQIMEDLRNESLSQGRREEVYSSVRDGDYSVERGAEKLGQSVEVFVAQMQAEGYRVPEPV